MLHDCIVYFFSSKGNLRVSYNYFSGYKFFKRKCWNLCYVCMHSNLMTCKIIDLARSQSQISNCHTLLRVPYLLGDGVSTLFGYVENVEHRCSEMGQGGDGLHLDGVPLFKRMIQDARCIYHLPAEVPVVHVADKQRFGGEGVWFHLYICSGNLEMANKKQIKFIPET